MTAGTGRQDHVLKLRAWWLGRVPYEEALDLQQRLRQQVLARRAHPGYLLLLDHPPVITAGRSSDLGELHVSPADLNRLGVEFVTSSRGGRLTYHGPGQLVGYPVIDLKAYRCDVHGYMRKLEDVLIRVLARLGLGAERREGHTGVWLGERKVASIGVAIRRWVTMHGFALNVDRDMTHFGLIEPCGLTPETMTSLAEALGWEPELRSLACRVAEAFAQVFAIGPEQMRFEGRPLAALSPAGAP